MSVVLAVDTSVSVAVGLADDAAGGGRVLGARTVDDPRAHVEQLTPTVAGVLADAGLTAADLDAIVVGMGPGPFTGLRVGIVTGWTLAETLDRPVHPVCGLDVIAAQWDDAPAEFVICTDARRRELYWAHYRDGARVGEPQVSAPDALPALPVAGPGVAHYADVLGDRAADGPTTLDPAVMALRGRSLPAAGTEPYYLRRPDAAVPSGRKSALPTGPRRLSGLGPRGRR